MGKIGRGLPAWMTRSGPPVRFELTGAEHLRRAESLLRDAANAEGAESSAALALRASAHLAAADLILDLQQKASVHSEWTSVLGRIVPPQS